MQIPDAARTLDRDLQNLFGDRVQSLVAYGPANPGESVTATLVIIDRLSAGDLSACAARIAGWHDAGLATPLLLTRDEFGRSLDAFPFEFGAILANHAVVSGTDPFQGFTVDPSHLRHACEVQARSHLLHLREGYLETRDRGDAIANLIGRSASPLAALVANVARLHGASGDDMILAAASVERSAALPRGSLQDVVRLANGGTLSVDAARRMFPEYLAAIEQLTAYVDRWSGR